MADVLYLLHYSWPILKATVLNAFEVCRTGIAATTLDRIAWARRRS